MISWKYLVNVQLMIFCLVNVTVTFKYLLGTISPIVGSCETLGHRNQLFCAGLGRHEIVYQSLVRGTIDAWNSLFWFQQKLELYSGLTGLTLVSWGFGSILCRGGQILNTLNGLCMAFATKNYWSVDIPGPNIVSHIVGHFAGDRTTLTLLSLKLQIGSVFLVFVHSNWYIVSVLYGGFLKYGVPPVLIHVWLGFSLIKPSSSWG